MTRRGGGVLVIEAKGAKPDREVHLIRLAGLIHDFGLALPGQAGGERLLLAAGSAPEMLLGERHHFFMLHAARHGDHRIAGGVPFLYQLAHVLGFYRVDGIAVPDDAHLQVVDGGLEHVRHPYPRHVLIHLQLFQDDHPLPVPLVLVQQTVVHRVRIDFQHGGERFGRRR